MILKEISQTKNSPKIIFDPKGKISIMGRSFNADTKKISRAVEEIIEEYLVSPPEYTSVDFYLDYLDGSKLKTYVSLLKKVETLKLKNKDYSINWFYEEGDEDILEKGEYISSILKIPFNFISILEPVDLGNSQEDS